MRADEGIGSWLLEAPIAVPLSATQDPLLSQHPLTAPPNGRSGSLSFKVCALSRVLLPMGEGRQWFYKSPTRIDRFRSFLHHSRRRLIELVDQLTDLRARHRLIDFHLHTIRFGQKFLIDHHAIKG